jgi:hypothetical protein
MSLVEVVLSNVKAVQEHLCLQGCHIWNWSISGDMLGVWIDGWFCSVTSFIYDLEVIEIFQSLVCSSQRTHYLFFIFIITNSCTVNISAVYITKVSLYIIPTPTSFDIPVSSLGGSTSAPC